MPRQQRIESLQGKVDPLAQAEEAHGTLEHPKVIRKICNKYIDFNYENDIRINEC